MRRQFQLYRVMCSEPGEKDLGFSAIMVDDWLAGQPVEHLTTIADVAVQLYMEDC